MHNSRVQRPNTLFMFKETMFDFSRPKSAVLFSVYLEVEEGRLHRTSMTQPAIPRFGIIPKETSKLQALRHHSSQASFPIQRSHPLAHIVHALPPLRRPRRPSSLHARQLPRPLSLAHYGRRSAPKPPHKATDASRLYTVRASVPGEDGCLA